MNELELLTKLGNETPGAGGAARRIPRAANRDDSRRKRRHAPSPAEEATSRPGGGLWAVGTIGTIGSTDNNDVEPVIALHP